MDSRRLGLRPLHQSLQGSDHTYVSDGKLSLRYSAAFSDRPFRPPRRISFRPSPVLAGGPARTATTARVSRRTGYSALMKIAFQCMTLVCDGLTALSPEHRRPCISTLGQFWWETDTNIPLTVTVPEGLIWGGLWCGAGERRGAGDRPQAADSALDSTLCELRFHLFAQAPCANKFRHR